MSEFKALRIVSDDQITLLKIKSLLNSMSYFIKKEHLEAYDEYHRLCRKYCDFSLEEAENLRDRSRNFIGF